MKGNGKTLLGVAVIAFGLQFGAAWATDVHIAAAKVLEPAFGTTSTEGPVITAFKSANPTYASYNFYTHTGPSGTYATTIANGLTASPKAYPYDLFLSADTLYPDSLTTYAEVSGVTVFSQGEVMQWSKGGINVETAFPTGATTIGICDEDMGPYGQAALDILNDEFGITEPTTSPMSIVRYSNIMMVDQAINSGAAQSGFVPTALHCSSGAVSGLPAGATKVIFTGTHYDHGGVVISDPSDTAAATAAGALLAWLAGAAGQAVLEDYCLAFP